MEHVDDSGVAYFKWQRHGIFVVGLLGFSLWLQLGLPTVRFGSEGDASSAWLLVFHILALGSLLVALVLRSAATILFVYPVLLIPNLIGLPEADRSLLLDGFTAIGIVTTTAMYIAVASAWLASDGVQTGRPEAESPRSRGRVYRRFVGSRVVPMLLILGIPLYAVLYDPVVVSTVAQSYPESPEVAQTFISLTVFFFWAVLAYTQFLIPALNLEYDRRRGQRSLREVARGESSRKKWLRLSIEIGVVLMVLSSVWFVAV